MIDDEYTACYPSLRDKAVLVTGGASGIGEAIVWELARQGAKVAFIDVAVDAAQDLIGRITAQGRPAPLFLPCDLVDIPATQAAVKSVVDRFGPLHGLVNNAADDTRQVMEDVGEVEFDWSINVNLRPAFFVIKAGMESMVQAGSGSIVLMSSLAWVKGARDLQAYSAAKAGLLGLSSSLAHKLGPNRIRVNAITPGAVMTERQRKLWFDEAARSAVLKAQCLAEHVMPEDIAAMTLFLLADDSRHITKQNFVVDGGR